MQWIQLNLAVHTESRDTYHRCQGDPSRPPHEVSSRALQGLPQRPTDNGKPRPYSVQPSCYIVMLREYAPSRASLWPHQLPSVLHSVVMHSESPSDTVVIAPPGLSGALVISPAHLLYSGESVSYSGPCSAPWCTLKVSIGAAEPGQPVVVQI